MSQRFLWIVLAVVCCEVISAAAQTELKVSGDWSVDATVPRPQNTPVQATLAVRPPQTIVVSDELYSTVPMFDPKFHPFGWNRGVALMGLRAAGCTTRHALDPASVIVRDAAGPDATTFQRGRDYDMDDICGAVGRVPGSRIAEKQSVYISYRYVELRIDAVVLTKSGQIVLREGTPHIATPLPPATEAGEQRLANIWLPGRPIKKLSPGNILPIQESAYPEPPKPSPTVAEALLSKTLKKLRDGQPVKILAWGDSVTECGWLPDADRWQDQFVRRLKQRFPMASIELIQQGWGGKNTELFLQAPAGHAHNYREKILDSRPDLIVSEFINDVPLSAEQVEQRYGKLLADFKAIGAEWVILTPHYCDPAGMGFASERDIDADPRTYVKALREFTRRHDVALADASLRWGRLWRQGLPYSTLLSNTINHPDPRGMALFADSLMWLFP